jgi:hypothetical protein
MGVFQEQSADTFNFDEDFKVVVADSGAESSNFTLEAQDATLQGYIPWNKQRSAVRYFLGFARADTAAPWRLRRDNPHWHPVFPWLYAHSISFAPYVVKANTANPNREPYVESPFSDDNWAANYRHVIATVKYRAFNHEFLPDDEIPGPEFEWQRNTTFRTAGRLEVLSADGISQLKFAETSGTGPSLAGLGTAFPAPVGVLMPKTSFSIDWNAVPFEYLSSSAFYFKPDKLLACVGKVNSTAFLGLPAGTCLMQPYEYTDFPWPIASDTSQSTVYEILKGVNVRFNFDYFNPTPGAAAPLTRGHNLMPWRGDGRWYAATRDGTANTAKALLEYTDFREIFTHVSAPALP